MQRTDPRSEDGTMRSASLKDFGRPSPNPFPLWAPSFATTLCRQRMPPLARRAADALPTSQKTTDCTLNLLIWVVVLCVYREGRFPSIATRPDHKARLEHPRGSKNRSVDGQCEALRIMHIDDPSFSYVSAYSPKRGWRIS